VDAVQAATKKKFDDGMAEERRIFTALMFTPESLALRHLFMAERAASKIPDVAEDTPKRDIKAVGVIGAGTMGGGISMNFLNAGIPVKILEMKQEALDRGVATIKKNYEAQVKKGKLKQDKYEQRMALLSTTLSYDDLKDADLIIEAVFEEWASRRRSSRSSTASKKGAILASNTSTLDVDKIAAFTEASAGRGRHALLQPRQRDEAARSGARQRPARTCWPPSWPLARRSRRPPWSRACATASSATA
jgi:3-hydroxyacyl-CoA dehydrogenase